MPAISVITPVRNGLPLIQRAYRSIERQTFADWEWLVADDGSADGTIETLRSWAAEDSRIRPLTHDENRGIAAARNTALRAARGETIAYLDHDDEYYPDYLACVMQMRDKADVLVFGYDIAEEDHRSDISDLRFEIRKDPGSPDPRAPTKGSSLPEGEGANSCRTDFGLGSEPSSGRFVHHLHRHAPGRGPSPRPGGAGRRVQRIALDDEDIEFVRRLARAGARFAFVQAKSGLYHVRADRASRKPRLTPRQRRTLLENWRAGRPLFEEVGDQTKDLTSDIRARPLSSKGGRKAQPYSQERAETKGGLRLAALRSGLHQRGGDGHARRPAAAGAVGLRVPGLLQLAASTPGKKSSSKRSSPSAGPLRGPQRPDRPVPGTDDLHDPRPGAGDALQLGLDPRRLDQRRRDRGLPRPPARSS